MEKKKLNNTIYTCFNKIRLKAEQKPVLHSYISQLLDERRVAILNKDYVKREEIEIKINRYEKDQNISIVG